MATVQTLVEQGTFIIDHTEFNRTGDKVFINEHFYSDKTPLLSVAAAGAYAILHNAFGLTLDPTICVPDEDVAACRAFTPTGTRFTAFYWLTLIFIGGSASLLGGAVLARDVDEPAQVAHWQRRWPWRLASLHRWRRIPLFLPAMFRRRCVCLLGSCYCFGCVIPSEVEELLAG